VACSRGHSERAAGAAAAQSSLAHTRWFLKMKLHSFPSRTFCELSLAMHPALQSRDCRRGSICGAPKLGCAFSVHALHSQSGPRPGVGRNSIVRVYSSVTFHWKRENSNSSRQLGNILKHLDTHNVCRGMTSSHTSTGRTTFLFAPAPGPAFASVLLHLHVGCMRPTLFGI
jgi:hypothetical protein